MNNHNIDVKTQTLAEFSKSENHNYRLEGEDKNPNVDQERTNQNYCVYGTPGEAKAFLKHHLDEIKKNSYHKTIRKDANVAISFVFSASPEFFFDFKKLGLTREKWDSVSWQDYETNEDGERVKKSPRKLAQHRKIIKEAWATIDETKVKAFEKQVIEHLKQEHKHLIDVVCHRDEKGIHWHARAMPIVIDPKTKKKSLSSKLYYRKGTLKKWREDLDKRMLDNFNLSSKRELELPPLTEKEYNQATTFEPIANQKRPQKLEIEKTGIVIKDYKKEDVEALIENRNKREQAFKKEIANLRKEIEEKQPILAKANIQKVQLEKLEKEHRKMKSKFTKIEEGKKEELRSIPCEEVLEMLGYIGKSENSTIRFKNEEFNIVVQKSTNKFFDNTSMEGGGGAIDLLMKVFKMNFKEAIDTLARRFDSQAIATLASTNKEQSKELIAKGIEAQQAELPKASNKSFNIDTVQNYLINERKIKPEIVQDLFDKKLLYADSRNNCIFTNQQRTFAFIRGTYKGKRYVANKGKVDFLKYDFNKSNSNDVYIFESAIDALSFRTSTAKDGEYIVLNGSGMISRVAELQLENKNLNLCFDNDDQGKAFCDKLSKQFDCNIYTPKGKDFNEDLTNGNCTKYEPTSIGNTTNSKTIGRKTSEASTNPTDRDKQTNIKIY